MDGLAGRNNLFTRLSIMASSPIKIAVTVVAIAVVGGALVYQNRTMDRLRADNAGLAQQVAELTTQSESHRLAAEKDSEALAQDSRQSAEVMRLRGEVSQLRRQLAEKPSVPVANTKPPEPVAQPEDKEVARHFGIRRMKESQALVLGLIL